MAKKRMYSFMEKGHSQRGIESTVLGGLSFVIFCALLYIAFYTQGEGGAYLGSVGFSSIVLAIIGLENGLMSFREKNVIHFFSKLGSVLNGVMLAAWMLIILLSIG